jgi:hypothetical protein
MNRFILLILLVGIGIYLYIVLYKNNNFFTNHVHLNHELINDDFIEQPIPKKEKHVNFSNKNEEFIIPNKEQNKNSQEMYNDIFIINPIEIEKTDLTLSENEYFN